MQTQSTLAASEIHLNGYELAHVVEYDSEDRDFALRSSSLGSDLSLKTWLVGAGCRTPTCAVILSSGIVLSSDAVHSSPIALPFSTSHSKWTTELGFE